MKGKALRRTLQSKDSIRFTGGAEVPLIVDTTELITPGRARQILRKNTTNRPIQWGKVEEYADAMSAGRWELHAQGIVLDADGNLLTGQQRLWAVIYSDTSILFRVSRGNPTSSARLLDRGRPQSARDLATRQTQRRHSPAEATVARGCCALDGNLRPSVDVLADVITARAEQIAAAFRELTGTKKTRELLMVIAAICVATPLGPQLRDLSIHAEELAVELATALHPQQAKALRGAAFGLGMQHARRVVEARHEGA